MWVYNKHTSSTSAIPPHIGRPCPYKLVDGCRPIVKIIQNIFILLKVYNNVVKTKNNNNKWQRII